MLQVCGGNRVPVLVFFSEDGFEAARCGDRTLAKYRAMMQDQAGPTCPTGLPIGTMVPNLPPGCQSVVIGGVNYFNCNGVYYRAGFQGNNIVYIVSQP